MITFRTSMPHRQRICLLMLLCFMLLVQVLLTGCTVKPIAQADSAMLERSAILGMNLKRTLNGHNKHALPPRNPYYSDATASTMHGGAVYGRLSLVPGPGKLDRPLREEEVTWRPAEIATWSNSYSSPYSNGRRVIWTGGSRQLMKFDADTLEPLASIPVREGPYMSAQDITDFVAKLDTLEGDEYYELALNTMLPDMAGATSAYKVVTNNHEVYTLVYNAANKKCYLRVYGDAIEGNPDSAIALKREWLLPAVTDADPYPFGLTINITFDNRVVLVTRNGVVYSLSRDLKNFNYLVLPRQAEVVDTSDTFRATDSFVRNTTPVDPDGGIYVVTHTDMHRVQWTGKKLSLDEKDGAWSAPYAGGEMGSGTSPALMGWGNEDKLVIIGDGRPEGNMHIWAFWRDKIPADWKGIEGLDRRVAGIAPVDYGKYMPKTGTIENSLPVKGYGVLVTNDYSPKQPPYYDKVAGREQKLFTHYYAVSKHSDYVPRGVLRYNWNPVSRELELVWSSDISLTTTIPMVDINNTVYGIGARDGIFTVEALDWNTGQPKFHYNLGKSNRFNPQGSSLMVAPNGALDCYCQGGAGIVRIHPQKDTVE